MSKIPPKIQTLSSAQAKETIYIDVDDEITAVIDKVTSSKAKIIALVLPKRATVMQSIVNMKLLKRTAEDAGKNIVLITSEASLMPLIGLVGMHVAATPTSKPVVPDAPDAANDEPESVDEPLDIVDGIATNPQSEFDPSAAAATPIGVLAANEPESILMSDDPDDTSEETTDNPAEPVAKPDKKLKVPNFSKFRLGVVASILAVILLITGWVFATVVLPKANVAITTDSTTITSELNLTLDTAAKTLDADNKIVPATAQSSSKSYSQDATATGQQNNGTKATGTVKLTTSICAPNLGNLPDNIAVGSTVSSSGNVYITNETGKWQAGTPKGSCIPYSTQSIAITALKGGANYNTSSDAAFSSPSGYTGTGTASGGTDNIVKVLAQADIDAAKDKITAQDTTTVKNDLENALKAKGLLPVPSTFLAGDQQITTSANVGDKVDTAKVSATVPYTMLGIKQDDLKKLVTANVDSQIDAKKQKIVDDGIANAKFSQQNPATTTSAVVAVKVRSTAGPELNVDALKKQIAGMKEGDVKDLLDGQPGIVDVQVAYSPAWVNKVPKDTKKLTIIIDGVTK